MRASTVAADVPARDDAAAILPRDSQSLAVRWALEASARGMSFKELIMKWFEDSDSLFVNEALSMRELRRAMEALRAEGAHALGDGAIEAFARELDKDRDGNVSRDEFATHLVGLLIVATEASDDTVGEEAALDIIEAALDGVRAHVVDRDYARRAPAFCACVMAEQVRLALAFYAAADAGDRFAEPPRPEPDPESSAIDALASSRLATRPSPPPEPEPEPPAPEEDAPKKKRKRRFQKATKLVVDLQRTAKLDPPTFESGASSPPAALRTSNDSARSLGSFRGTIGPPGSAVPAPREKPARRERPFFDKDPVVVELPDPEADLESHTPSVASYLRAFHRQEVAEKKRLKAARDDDAVPDEASTTRRRRRRAAAATTAKPPVRWNVTERGADWARTAPTLDSRGHVVDARRRGTLARARHTWDLAGSALGGDVSLRRRPLFDPRAKLFEASDVEAGEAAARASVMASVAPGVTVRTSDGQSAHRTYVHDADNMSLGGFQTLRLSEVLDDRGRPLPGESLLEGATVITEVPSASLAPDPRPPRTPPPTKRTPRSARPRTAPDFGGSVAAATYRPRRHVEYDLLTGKIVPEDPGVFEVVHSVVVMTEDERQLPVPLERPASPLLFPLPDRADSPLSVTF